MGAVEPAAVTSPPPCELAKGLRAARIESRVAQGKSLYGGDAAWRTLGPLFGRLSEAYGVDWGPDADFLRAWRLSDAQVASSLSTLDVFGRKLEKWLRSDLKKVKGSGNLRKTATRRVAAMRDKVTELERAVRKGGNAETVLAQVRTTADQVADFMADKSLSPETRATWQSIDTTLAEVEAEFGLRPPARS